MAAVPAATLIVLIAVCALPHPEAAGGATTNGLFRVLAPKHGGLVRGRNVRVKLRLSAGAVLKTPRLNGRKVGRYFHKRRSGVAVARPAGDELSHPDQEQQPQALMLGSAFTMTPSLAQMSISRAPIRLRDEFKQTQEAPMKYILLINSGNGASEFEKLSEEEQKGVLGEYMAISGTDGVLGGDQLQPPETATTVRVDGGRTLTTDGPYVETKDALGGYFLFEAEDLDAAIELASRIPAARFGGSVEVRPLVER
jgi:hypothetical protein